MRSDTEEVVQKAIERAKANWEQVARLKADIIGRDKPIWDDLCSVARRFVAEVNSVGEIDMSVDIDGLSANVAKKVSSGIIKLTVNRPVKKGKDLAARFSVDGYQLNAVPPFRSSAQEFYRTADEGLTVLLGVLTDLSSADPVYTQVVGQEI